MSIGPQIQSWERMFVSVMHSKEREELGYSESFQKGSLVNSIGGSDCNRTRRKEVGLSAQSRLWRTAFNPSNSYITQLWANHPRALLNSPCTLKKKKEEGGNKLFSHSCFLGNMDISWGLQMAEKSIYRIWECSHTLWMTLNASS